MERKHTHSISKFLSVLRLALTSINALHKQCDKIKPCMLNELTSWKHTEFIHIQLQNLWKKKKKKQHYLDLHEFSLLNYGNWFCHFVSAKFRYVRYEKLESKTQNPRLDRTGHHLEWMVYRYHLVFSTGHLALLVNSSNKTKPYVHETFESQDKDEAQIFQFLYLMYLKRYYYYYNIL